MGHCMSRPSTNPSPPTNLHTDMRYKSEPSSYEAASRVDEDLRSLDTNLPTRTNHVANTLIDGVEVKAASFHFLKEVAECYLDMDQEVNKVDLVKKEDTWKSQEIFDLIQEYFETSLQTIDFCSALKMCQERVEDSRSLIRIALKRFDKDNRVSGGNNNFKKTLEKLRNFKESGDPFTEEFFKIFQAVYKHRILMLEKLQTRRNKLDKRLKGVHTWRKVSCTIFVSTLAAVLICSTVAAAVAAPLIAAALAAASAIPIGSMGKYVDSLWKNYEDVLKGQKEVISSMQAGTNVAIKDLDNIRVLVDMLEMQIWEMMANAEFGVDKGAVKIAMEEIKKKFEVFLKNAEELGNQAGVCGRDIKRARTVVLQRIINSPSRDETSSKT